MKDRSASDAELWVRSLLDAWPLGEVTRIERVPMGATNRVYRIEAQSQSVFLRVYRHPDRALVEREHALLAHARAQALPVVEVLSARSGSSVVEVGGTFCALYAAAQGVQLPNGELTSAHASSAGATLARLHQALALLPDTGYLRWNLSWDGAEWVERLNVVERALLAHGMRDATDRWALERVRAQRNWLAQPECPHRHEPRCPAQVTHGDYQLTNLFFDGPHVSAVIDWEQAAWMPRGYEVVRACAFLFRLEPERTHAFLHAYRTLQELDEPALEDGARGWGCFSDHHVFPVEEAYLHGNRAARQYIIPSSLGSYGAPLHAPFRPFRDAWTECMGSLSSRVPAARGGS